MNNNSQLKEDVSKKGLKRAMKHYKTYLEHYKSRNLTSMPLEEFLKNYKI